MYNYLSFLCNFKRPKIYDKVYVNFDLVEGGGGRIYYYVQLKKD